MRHQRPRKGDIHVHGAAVDFCALSCVESTSGWRPCLATVIVVKVGPRFAIRIKHIPVFDSMPASGSHTTSVCSCSVHKLGVSCHAFMTDNRDAPALLCLAWLAMMALGHSSLPVIVCSSHDHLITHAHLKDALVFEIGSRP